MFNSITGILSGMGPDYVWVRSGGIEWDIGVPARAVAGFGAEGSEVTVYTWLHHYEDGMKLFGFPSLQERAVFLALMKVEGIGPKQALKVLSGIAPADLGRALDSGDLAALQKIPGVGPKMAQKMVLALKGVLVERPEAERGATAGASTLGPWADLARSLVDMGFDRRAVEAVVRREAAAIGAAEAATAGAKSGKGAAASDAATEKELFRRALMDLSAGGAS